MIIKKICAARQIFIILSFLLNSYASIHKKENKVKASKCLCERVKIPSESSFFDSRLLVSPSLKKCKQKSLFHNPSACCVAMILKELLFGRSMKALPVVQGYLERVFKTTYSNVFAASLKKICEIEIVNELEDFSFSKNNPGCRENSKITFRAACLTWINRKKTIYSADFRDVVVEKCSHYCVLLHVLASYIDTLVPIKEFNKESHALVQELELKLMKDRDSILQLYRCGTNIIESAQEDIDFYIKKELGFRTQNVFLENLASESFSRSSELQDLRYFDDGDAGSSSDEDKKKKEKTRKKIFVPEMLLAACRGMEGNILETKGGVPHYFKDIKKVTEVSKKNVPSQANGETSVTLQIQLSIAPVRTLKDKFSEIFADNQKTSEAAFDLGCMVRCMSPEQIQALSAYAKSLLEERNITDGLFNRSSSQQGDHLEKYDNEKGPFFAYESSSGNGDESQKQENSSPEKYFPFCQLYFDQNEQYSL